MSRYYYNWENDDGLDEQHIEAILQFATDNRKAHEGNNLNGYVLEAMKENLGN